MLLSYAVVKIIDNALKQDKEFGFKNLKMNVKDKTNNILTKKNPSNSKYK